MKIVKKIVSAEKKDNVLHIDTNAAKVRAAFITDDIFRLRVSFDGGFNEDSYVVGNPQPAGDFELRKTEDGLMLIGAGLDISITDEPFTVTIKDKSGNILHRDVKYGAYMCDSNSRRSHRQLQTPQDHFYGFGERSGELNKAGRRMQLAPADAFGYDPEVTDCLYKHIPFYIRLNDATHNACGYYYNCTTNGEFNMGQAKSNYFGDSFSTFTADNGEIDLFFINGPKIRQVIGRYTDITGKSAMLPKKALGYLGSSMYYAELDSDCDRAILDFADKAREEDIPMDGFMLSSGYTTVSTENGDKRCVFEWNDRRFPDPEEFFEQMDKKGILVSPNIKPGILTCHPKFAEFAAKGMFIKDSEKDTPAVGAWWGGDGAYVDFTSPDAREAWSEYMTDALLNKGVKSIWNDNCEYDGLFDRDSRVCLEGKGGTIGEIAAVMPNLMCETAMKAILKADSNVRPFVVCRSGHSGIQKFAQTWAGDNFTSWETLKYNVATILGMGLSGVANHGCDVGGFGGPAPGKELLVRWVQNGIFFPRFSIHSVNSDNTVTEPWMYESVKGLIHDAIKLRYRMMPYLYSLMYRAHESGLPIMEAMVSAFQDDPEDYDEFETFMFGDSLLVSTVVNEGQREKNIYLPAGCDFYDFYTHEKYKGGQSVKVSAGLADIPMFIKEGAVLPLEDRLIVTPGEGSFTLYEDDGESMEYLDGKYKKTLIKVSGSGHMTISMKKEGSFDAGAKDLLIEVISGMIAPLFVRINGTEIRRYLDRKAFENAREGFYFNPDSLSVIIKQPYMQGDRMIEVSFEPEDMLGM